MPDQRRLSEAQLWSRKSPPTWSGKRRRGNGSQTAQDRVDAVVREGARSAFELNAKNPAKAMKSVIDEVARTGRKMLANQQAGMTNSALAPFKKAPKGIGSERTACSNLPATLKFAYEVSLSDELSTCFDSGIESQ